MLDGKIALVTGAGQGIGRAIAVEIAQQGAAGVAVVDRNRDTAEEASQAVRDAGAASIAITCDLRDRDQIEAMVTETVSALSGLDVLVNNAGIIETTLTDTATVESIPENVWDAVYEVNLKAPWLAIKLAVPHLRRSKRGPSIVNAASVSGLTGFRDAPIYCASKGGLIQLTRAAAADLAPAIRCNCFCPGVIGTPMARAFIAAAPDPPARERTMTSSQLVDRLGEPEEVAKLACFLASDHAAFITGAAYVIDGGALAWAGA